MYYQRFFAIFSLLAASVGPLSAQALFHKPVKVLGDPNFIGTASNPLAVSGIGPNVVEGRELNLPSAVAVDNSVSPPNVYIADSGNNRVLGFRYNTQLKAGAFADLIIGQTDRFGNQQQGGGRSTGLSGPGGLAVDTAGNLYVADTGNNRILRFANPFLQSGGVVSPNMVIGQSSFSGKSANAGGLSGSSLALSTSTTFRSGITFDIAGNLWVADTSNNRVLRFPVSVLKAGQNNPAADLVVGQPDFVSRLSTSVRNNKNGLTAPQGVAFDVAGRLLVTDAASRVVVYPAAVSLNPVAFRIVGVDITPNSTNTTQIALSNPLGVIGTQAGLIVADTANNRLVTFPTVDNFSPETAGQYSPSATGVIGQPSYTVAKVNQGFGDASAMSFNAPVDLAASQTEIFVADAQNNRVLVFPYGAAGIGATASRVIGQLDFPYFATNLIEGKEFGFGLSQTSNVTGSVILDQSVSPPHLYVADTQNNRILGFKDFTHLQNLQTADIVIGQPDFLRSQINYPTNDPAQLNAAGLHQPTSLAIDSAGNLYVSDTGNSRVLRFPAPFSSGRTNLESADLVIGQADFRSIVTDPSAQNLSAPIGIALTADAANASINSGFLVVADSGHNRVLIFPKPFVNGMSALKVLGESNFLNSAPSTDPQRFSVPRGLAVDPQDRLLVADTGNHRVQIYNKVATLNNFDTPPVSIATGLNQPVAITSNNSGFWVADGGASELVHYPVIDQLGIRNNAADATQPANQPLSAFLDNFNNLLIADGANRVLYFSPQANVISAANYSGRPLAAGSIASIYPTTMSTVIAAGTGDFKSVLPLPNSISDTQVLVNGNPAPLFFVSPGQINFVLPNGLATGGTADVQIVRQSTGQIYAGAEIGLAAADPALFTSNTSGSGQVAAYNVVDGSINSPLNPVARGQFIALFGTGIGPVPNAPPDGQAPSGIVPASDLPQIVIGASTVFLPAADIQYSGLAPGLVGVWQINLMIPADATVGSSVPIKVFEGSIPNTDPANFLGNTTIAIK